MEELERIIALFSPWERNSEISRFNGAPEGTWALSDAFWTVLTRALELADDTNGAVDPTLGSLVDLWGFGPPGRRSPLLPLPEDHILACDLLDAEAVTRLIVTQAARYFMGCSFLVLRLYVLLAWARVLG